MKIAMKDNINPIRSRLFLQLKGPAGSLGLAQWNSAEWYYYLWPTRIHKEIFRNLTNDLKITASLKTKGKIWTYEKPDKRYINRNLMMRAFQKCNYCSSVTESKDVAI